MLSVLDREFGEFFANVEDAKTGKSLQQYACTKAGNEASCYIQSIIGQYFRVYIQCMNRTACFAVDLFFDGQLVRSSYIGRYNDLIDDSDLSIECFDYGHGQTIPLKFGKTRALGTDCFSCCSNCCKEPE